MGISFLKMRAGLICIGTSGGGVTFGEGIFGLGNFEFSIDCGDRGDWGEWGENEAEYGTVSELSLNCGVGLGDNGVKSFSNAASGLWGGEVNLLWHGTISGENDGETGLIILGGVVGAMGDISILSVGDT